MTIVQANKPDLLTLSELFNYSKSVFAPTELHYQDSLYDYLLKNLDATNVEGEPVVSSSLSSDDVITQAQLNRIWGKLLIKVFLPRSHESLEAIVTNWVEENGLHPVGEPQIEENVARLILEVPLVIIK